MFSVFNLTAIRIISNYIVITEWFSRQISKLKLLWKTLTTRDAVNFDMFAWLGMTLFQWAMRNIWYSRTLNFLNIYMKMYYQWQWTTANIPIFTYHSLNGFLLKRFYPLLQHYPHSLRFLSLHSCMHRSPATIPRVGSTHLVPWPRLFRKLLNSLCEDAKLASSRRALIFQRHVSSLSTHLRSVKNIIRLPYLKHSTRQHKVYLLWQLILLFFFFFPAWGTFSVHSIQSNSFIIIILILPEYLKSLSVNMVEKDQLDLIHNLSDH